jgi:hypothetical protein
MATLYKAGLYKVDLYEADVGPLVPPVTSIRFLAFGPGGGTAVGSSTVAPIVAERLYADWIIAFYPPSGLWLFSERQIRDNIGSDPPSLGRFATLLEVSGLDFRTVPIGEDLISSIASSEDATVRLLLRNENGWWTKELALEPVIRQPIGLWADWGGSEVYLFRRGEVRAIDYTWDEVSIEVGRI